MAQRQIILFPASGQVDQIELGDDQVGHTIKGGVPKQSRTVESRDVAGAKHKTQINHGNKVNAYSWSVDRDHGTETAAVAFMRDHPDSIPDDIGIARAVLQETGDDGSIRFLQNCAVESIECVSWDGQSTVFKYTVKGSAWTDTINAV